MIDSLSIFNPQRSRHKMLLSYFMLNVNIKDLTPIYFGHRLIFLYPYVPVIFSIMGFVSAVKSCNAKAHREPDLSAIRWSRLLADYDHSSIILDLP
jgi:hypothetical protein